MVMLQVCESAVHQSEGAGGGGHAPAARRVRVSHPQTVLGRPRGPQKNVSTVFSSISAYFSHKVKTTIDIFLKKMHVV